jgi:hypothetical protein
MSASRLPHVGLNSRASGAWGLFASKKRATLTLSVKKCFKLRQNWRRVSCFVISEHRASRVLSGGRWAVFHPMRWLAMYEQDLWSMLYIFLVFIAFISGLGLRAAARSQYNNEPEPWHARLAAAEGKPRHDGIIISKTATGWVSGVLLSVVALTAIAAGAIFFWPGWPDNLDPQVSATLRAGQQQTTSGIEAINDRPAAEKFLAQTRGTKAPSDSIAAQDQFMALSTRLSTLKEDMTRILRDNAGLAEQLRTIQTQLAQDNVLIAERLKALTQTQMAARPGVVAMGSEEGERLVTTGPTATAPAATRSRTAHRKDQARLRADGSLRVAGRSRASPAPTARSSSSLPPSPAW